MSSRQEANISVRNSVQDIPAQEKLIFKFSFANKNMNEQSPTRAISVSSSSSSEKKQFVKSSDTDNERLQVTAVKLRDPEPTYMQNETLQTPSTKEGIHPYAQAI